MRLSVRQKLLIISVTPLLLALALGIASIRQTLSQLDQEGLASRNLEAISALSTLIGSLQRERGMSSLLLTGVDNVGVVRDLRQKTDQAWESAQPRIQSAFIPPSEQSMAISAMEDVARLRVRVDAASVAERSSFSEYTLAVTALMNTIEAASRMEVFNISGYFRTIVLFEEAKEHAGRTRALVSSMYARDRALSDGEIFDLINTYSAIRVNLKNRSIAVSPKVTIVLNELLSTPAWYQVQGEVLYVLSKAGEGRFERDALAFFDTATEVIDKIQQVINLSIDEAYSYLMQNRVRLNSSIVLISSTIGLSILFIAALSLMMLINITGRIGQVAEGMKEISSGDADLTRRIRTKAQDELGLLAAYFNSFASTLQDLINQVKTETATLQNGFIKLSSNTEETAGAIRQITANIESIKAQTMNQNASVTGSSKSVERINHNVGTLHRLIEEQANGVASSSSSIEEMVANIQSVTANIERMGGYYEKLLGKSASGKQAIETVTKQVREIDSQSETLQEANGLIAGIAAQTNLLAMNAAIEAAHAGQAGRGFAVVADEIRKLAENAATQSKSISGNIRNIRSVINAVVASSGLSAHTFEDILEQIHILSRLEEEIRHSMNEQNSGSVQVVESISSINKITTEVKQAAQDMQENANAVLQEMRRLLQLSSELDNGMAEMAAGAEEIRRAAEDTSELSSQTSRSVQALRAEVDKFKT